MLNNYDLKKVYEEEATYYEVQYWEENYRHCIMAKRDEVIANGDEELASSLMSLVFKISTIPYKIAGNEEPIERFANEYKEFRKIANEGSRQEIDDFLFKAIFEGEKVVIFDAEKTAKHLQELGIKGIPEGTILEHDYKQTYLLHPDGHKETIHVFDTEEKKELEVQVLKIDNKKDVDDGERP